MESSDLPDTDRVVRREVGVEGGYIYWVELKTGGRQYLRWENVPSAAQHDYMQRNPNAAKEDKAGRFLPAKHLKAHATRSRRAENEKKRKPRPKSTPRTRR